MTPAETKFHFHLLGPSRWSAVPFSDSAAKKAAVLSRMLLSLGHEVYVYGEAGSIECTEFIPLPTDTLSHYHGSGVTAVNERKRPDDFLLVMRGVAHKPIADAAGLWLTCEPAIDYHGSYTSFRAFTSAYLQNFTYGSENPRQMIDGNPYDRTIPNAFDSRDFIFTPESGDYFLYIGRGSDPDGMETAAVATSAAHGRLTYLNLNHAGPEERARLMGYAKAVVITDTRLGDASVEAQLCGTPVITTNFGVFPETVVDQVTGFRCNTLQDFVNAARWVGRLDRTEVRRHAERYLMDNVKYEFHQWFCDLYQLYLSTEPGVKGWGHYE